MALILPASMRCFSETWRIKMASRSGGQSLTGTEQIVSSPAGRWVAKASFHLLDQDDAQLDVRGFIAALDGQAGTFMIGPTDWRGQPWAVDPALGGVFTPDQVDKALLDPVLNPPNGIGILDFALASSVAMNATSATVQRNVGGFLRRGQYFQIGERLHIIIGLTTPEVVDPDTGLAAPGPIGIQFRPWTRAAYAAGTPLNFYAPRCLMRFADGDQGGIEMATSPLSDLSLDLIEAF